MSKLKPASGWMIFTAIFVFIQIIFSQQLIAQQGTPPFSIDLNLGGGLIGDSNVNTAFQPELGLSYLPGNWGVGLNAGLYSFNSGFNVDQYRTGFEQFTQSNISKNKWSAFFINAGPRFQFGSRLPFQLTAGLDLAMSYKNPPSQQVEFYDPDSQPGADDPQLILADMEAGDDYSKWTAAIRPQIELGFQPFRSNRIGFNIKTGIQHHLSDREFTYSQRDLSEVQSVDNSREMFIQFENAPVVQRTETASKTNFFANAGVTIRFGGSKADSKKALDGFSNVTDDFYDEDSDNDGIDDEVETAQDYNAARSNKPTSRTAPDDTGDCDDDDPCPRPDDAVAPAQDYNSSRSNKPSSIAADVSGGGNSDVDTDSIETAKDYNSSRSNKPRSETPDDIFDIDSDDDGVDDSIETAQDYNAARSNKPTSRADESAGNGSEFVYEAMVMARLVNPAGTILSAGRISISAKGKKALGLELNTENGGDPLYEGESTGGENPLNEGQANDGNFDNNNENTIPGLRYELQPSSYCVSLSRISDQVLKTFFETGDKPTPSQYDDLNNSIVEELDDAKSVYTQEEINFPENLKPDTDEDGFPEMIKSASFSISKRSARTGRNKSPIHEGDTNTQTSPLYEPKDELANNGGDSDGDGSGDVDGLHFELEINDMKSRVSEVISKMDSETPTSRADSSNNAPPGVQIAPSQTKVILLGITDNGDIIPLEESKLSELNLNGDPDSDDDGLMDSVESATFSISKRSARTGRSAGSELETMESKEGVDPNTKQTGDNQPPADVHKWTYNLNELEGTGDLPAAGTLTVLFTGGEWHFDLQIDPDVDGDGYGDLLRNSSFSISKRSARTGR